MYIAGNIRYLRKSAKLTQSELGKRLGYKSAAAVNKWEVGDNTPPSKTLDKLAKLFNVGVEELLYVDLSIGKKPVLSGDSVRINVYSSVHAGIPNESIDEVVDWEDIPASWTTSNREYFGVKVKGDSMEPEYKDGDTIIVQKQSTYESGDDCIVRIDGYEAVLRKVLKSGTSVILQPLNPAYPPEIFTGDDSEPEISINGVVRELRRKK